MITAPINNQRRPAEHRHAAGTPRERDQVGRVPESVRRLVHKQFERQLRQLWRRQRRRRERQQGISGHGGRRGRRAGSRSAGRGRVVLRRGPAGGHQTLEHGRGQTMMIRGRLRNERHLVPGPHADKRKKKTQKRYANKTLFHHGRCDGFSGLNKTISPIFRTRNFFQTFFEFCEQLKHYFTFFGSR